MMTINIYLNINGVIKSNKLISKWMDGNGTRSYICNERSGIRKYSNAVFMEKY